MNNEIKEMKSIINQLNEASALYYNGRLSPLTDKQWDNLFDKLKKLEEDTNIILSNSPTQKVGCTTLNKLQKVKHNTPMLSLQKTKSIDELEKFLNHRDGILSYKLDGLTTVLEYNNGKLIQAVTRGNGEVGSDVTHHISQFLNVPQTIPYKHHLVVRGESIIKLTDFEIINKDNEYANARNLASGTLNQLDNKITKERRMSFIVFGITESDEVFNDISEQFIWLKRLGFEVVPYNIVDKNNLAFTIETFSNEIRIDGIFPCDGLVLMYNDIDYGNSLGFTSHHPLNGIAFKWQDATVETTLRDIEWQIGRTGVLTPVAVFDTVEIEGSNVSKASLHNLSILKSLELGINDKLTIYKANLIIPQVDDNLTRSNTYEIPSICPICGKPLTIEKPNDTENLVCHNCDGLLAKKLEHYCSKECMDIEGLSKETIQLLVNKGLLTGTLSIYDLHDKKRELLQLPKFGAKKVDNLINAIEKSKHQALWRFIHALGIDGVGKSTSKNIEKYLIDKYNLTTEMLDDNFIMKIKQKISIQELLNIKDMGDITAKSIMNELKKYSYHIELLFKKLDIYVEEKKTTNNNAKLPLSNLNIYCTGTFACGKKNDLKLMVENNGGIFANGYTKSLDMLVIGSLKGSSKEDKAKKDGVRIVNENEFLEMIK